jgi:hypothetical protein
MSSIWARILYTGSYICLIIGIGLCLLVTGYDLVQQVLALSIGGGKYFYIVILGAAYAVTVPPPPPPQCPL